jgi:hypothetical protein
MASPLIIPAARSELTDLKDSRCNVAWWQFFQSIMNRLNGSNFTNSGTTVAVTSTTDSTLAATLTAQAGSAGVMRLTLSTSCTNNANVKTVTVKLGTTTIQTITLDASTETQTAQITIVGRGVDDQYTSPASLINCTASGGIASNESMAGTSTIAIYMQLGTITDTITLESWTLEVEKA